MVIIGRKWWLGADKKGFQRLLEGRELSKWMPIFLERKKRNGDFGIRKSGPIFFGMAPIFCFGADLFDL